MSFTRIFALSLALMFVTTIGITAFTPAAHAGAHHIWPNENFDRG
jgi:hypothetical protein